MPFTFVAEFEFILLAVVAMTLQISSQALKVICFVS